MKRTMPPIKGASNNNQATVDSKFDSKHQRTAHIQSLMAASLHGCRARPSTPEKGHEEEENPFASETPRIPRLGCIARPSTPEAETPRMPTQGTTGRPCSPAFHNENNINPNIPMFGTRVERKFAHDEPVPPPIPSEQPRRADSPRPPISLGHEYKAPRPKR